MQPVRRSIYEFFAVADVLIGCAFSFAYALPQTCQRRGALADGHQWQKRFAAYFTKCMCRRLSILVTDAASCCRVQQSYPSEFF